MIEDEGFDGYVPDTVDPGAAMLAITLLICFLLIACLPCFISMGRWCKSHCGKCSKATEDIMESSGRNASTSIAQVIRSRPSRDEDDNVSVNSKATGITSVVNALVISILDSSPRGGPNLTNNKLATLNREHTLEAEARSERERGYDMRDLRSECRSDARSVADNSTVGHGSVLGKLDQDAVSIHDAVDAQSHLYEDAIGLVDKKPVGSWWSRSRWVERYNFILTIAEYDYESKRLCKLGLPFVAQSFLGGLAEAARVAVIGKMIGTTALSAYIVVDMVVGVTTEVMRGFQGALITLCSQSLGVGNKTLTGQYVQMTVIVYTILYIPIFVFWYYFIVDAMLWFEFDENTASVGQDFAVLLLLAEMIKGLDESIHSLLDVIGCENYSTVFTVGREVFLTIGAYVAARQPEATLQYVGYVYVGVQGCGLVLNVVIVLWNGWLDPYLEGMIGSLSLTNVRGLRLLLSTTSSMSLGYLLTDGEWEILTIFAGILGPAEVAAWGVLGALWDALEFVTQAIGNAAEVRTSYLLGAGQPHKAKMSSYKSLYLGTIATVLITSCLFIAGDQIPTWMTSDATVQHMIHDLIPLFGIGNIALSLGSLSWTLVGAQGRYRLATSVGFAGSWLVTIPLCVICSVWLRIDLQGQTSAIVIGYMVSGTINTYILLDSDWELLSKKVIDYNAEHGISDSEDDEGSSSGSSSSDGSSNSDSDPSLSGRPDPVSLYKAD